MGCLTRFRASREAAESGWIGLKAVAVIGEPSPVGEAFLCNSPGRSFSGIHVVKLLDDADHRRPFNTICGSAASRPLLNSTQSSGGC